MILTDYLTSEYSRTWDYAKQCGVDYAAIRLPETDDFDITEYSHWKCIEKRFYDFGIQPLVLEPIPNALHDHIKCGDSKRDESIEKFIRALPFMAETGITTVCFNFMAHVGWLRTAYSIPDRGGALVTGFNRNDYIPINSSISEDAVWNNYRYFIDAVIPEAEKYNIKFALHPDDPPISQLGDVSRIMISVENIKRAIDYRPSNCLGITLCQATYRLMGTDLTDVVRLFGDKVMNIHFRNNTGVKDNFRESFHDNGVINMAAAIQLYENAGLNVPIRVDHVPLMAGEDPSVPGYSSIGRLFAIGYLKGLLESVEQMDNAKPIYLADK